MLCLSVLNCFPHFTGCLIEMSLQHVSYFLYLNVFISIIFRFFLIVFDFILLIPCLIFNCKTISKIGLPYRKSSFCICISFLFYKKNIVQLTFFQSSLQMSASYIILIFSHQQTQHQSHSHSSIYIESENM